MKHILVPIDLLSELAESLACELDARYPASVRSYESQDRKYQAEMEPVLTARQIIAVAPAVQGEPVATIHVDGSFVHVAWRISAPSRCAMDVYTAPQPAEQPAEQQPAPDVPGLTEALRQYQHNDGSGLVFGYDKLLVDRYVAGLVEALDLALEYWRDRQQRYKNRRPKWVVAAESALAALRKGGES